MPRLICEHDLRVYVMRANMHVCVHVLTGALLYTGVMLKMPIQKSSNSSSLLPGSFPS